MPTPTHWLGCKGVMVGLCLEEAVVTCVFCATALHPRTVPSRATLYVAAFLVTRSLSASVVVIAVVLLIVGQQHQTWLCYFTSTHLTPCRRKGC